MTTQPSPLTTPWMARDSRSSTKTLASGERRMTKYIFTDTNLYEHFPPLTDVDWLTLADCETAVLIVPAIVITELNNHKDGATRARLKKKAKSVLSRLS